MILARDQPITDNENSTNNSAGLSTDNMDSSVEEIDVTVRKCGETLYNTVSKVATAAIECTKGYYF